MSHLMDNRVLDDIFKEDVSFWPRSISCDLLSLPTGSSTKALVKIPPANMLDLFRRGTACWHIAEVDRAGEDPAAAILSNQGDLEVSCGNAFKYECGECHDKLSINTNTFFFPPHRLSCDCI
jgi:hypothetical protein